MNQAKIILVDDDDALLNCTSELLAEVGYTVYPFSNGRAALIRFQEELVDLVLTDIKMPIMTGIELLEKIRAFDQDTPVLLMTGYAELDVALAAIKRGASDFIVKPYKLPDLNNAIEKALQLNRKRQTEKTYQNRLEKEVKLTTQELTHSFEIVSIMSRVVIELLTLAAESRNEYPGLHNSLIGMLSNRIARALGMPKDFIDTITGASAMHDAWKKVIPHSILEKIACLTSNEFQLIQTHATSEERILRGTTYPMLQMAASIALTYRERWDGTGYPNKLRGENIPIEGRIVMLVDQYNELRKATPLHQPLDHETAYRYITEGNGETKPEYFDPKVIQAFKETSAECAEIFEKLQF
jgi:putative two-component system response regulator